MASIGDVIGGRYKIIEEVGRGGMSIVYLAMDMELKSNWALKEIRRSTNESKYEKALREARLMSEFKYRGIPIIVNILEYEDNQLAYIVMEYIPGKSLQDIMIERNSPFPENFVVQAGIQIADILNYLHSNDTPIIHRDIKPANIIYAEKDNSFWLLDFGEAKRLDKSEKDDRVSGTPGFMAPEQRSEKQGGLQSSNQLSDLFSLGASMFYMLTGQISEKSSITNQYYSIMDISDKVSVLLCNTISKAMNTIPKHRYSNVTEFKNALIACTEDVINKKKKAVKNIRRDVYVFSSSILLLIGGIVCNAADTIKNNQSYDMLIKSAGSESGDIDKKIEDALSAIDLKPDELKPYEVLMELYESDNIFDKDEESKFQSVITPHKDKLRKKSGYSDFAYQIGTMYLIYYNESPYIKSIDWFSEVDGTHKDEAEVYLSIGQFDRDIQKKINIGNESGEFKKQWDSLNNALDIAGQKNNDLLLMTICKKVISAMYEYCSKFKKDGISKAEMEDALKKVNQYIEDFIPNDAEYQDNSGKVTFEKYFNYLKQEQDESKNSSTAINGTDKLFMDIYPLLSDASNEINRIYK